MVKPLILDKADFNLLFARQGPSLGLWRAAEIAALREQPYAEPVLDLGCGDGLVASLVLPAVEVGLDPDPQALEKARRRGIYRRLEATPAELCTLPDGSFGTVISNSVMEHVSHPTAVLTAVARMLRPGGRFIFTTPTEQFSSWLALPLAPYARWRNRQLEHRNLMGLAGWGQFLKRAGLEIEATRAYLNQKLVRLWDTLELLQQPRLGERLLFGIIWRHMPSSFIERLSQWAAQLDLAAAEPGGGRLIVAQKR